MVKLDRAKDLVLLAFWSVAYFLKVIVQLPYLWIKEKFK